MLPRLTVLVFTGVAVRERPPAAVYLDFDDRGDWAARLVEALRLVWQ